MIRISLLHPSRGRPKLAFEVVREWMTKSDNPNEIEYIIGIDHSDPLSDSYFDHADKFSDCLFGNFFINIGNSNNIVQATNRIAKIIEPSSELIVGVTDDVGCPEHWDIELLNVLRGIDNFREPKFICISDGMYPYGTRVQSSILNRAFYDRLGWILFPEYHGMWADNDLFECAKRIGIIDAPHLLFEHRHFLKYPDRFDDSYKRTNSPEDMKFGEEIFIRRRERNFDL